MEPHQPRVLRVVKNEEPNFRRMFFVALFYFSLYLVPVTQDIYWSTYYAGNTLIEQDTRMYIHDLKAFEKSSRSYPSSWHTHDAIINGSSYAPSVWENSLILPSFVMFCDWKTHADLLTMWAKSLFQLVWNYLIFLKKKFGWRKVALYLCICSCFTVISLYGGLEMLTTGNRYLKDNLIQWLESRILVVPHERDPLSTKGDHPLTGGLEPPFYIYRFYRHYKEDVVFQCEYVVKTYRKARPVFKTSGWRKQGIPVVPNDKIHVNTSITRLKESTGDPDIQWFSIITNLTIKLIGDEDFGSYTCDFYNPMRVVVRPGPTMSKDYTKDSKKPPATPNPKCKCKSSPSPPPPPRCPAGYTKEKQGQCDERQFQDDPAWLYRNFVCFAEFQLKLLPERIVPVKLNPGSILEDSTYYITVSEAEDMEYDITSYSEDSQEHNCCSQLVRLYWLLTRTSPIAAFPTSRLIHHDAGFVFMRGQCLCKSSFGLRDFVVYRNIYNSTLGTEERIAISSPRKLQLIPELSHPFSERNQSTNQSYNTECWDTDRSSPSCQFHSDLLEAAINVFVFYEGLILTVSLVLGTVACMIFPLATHRCCIKPFANACLYYGEQNGPFTPAKGPCLKKLRPYQEQQNERNKTNPDYGFYLSYDEEDVHDLQLAQYFKEWLQTKGFSVFDTRTNILPGQHLMAEIEKAIPRCCRFIVIMSKNYTDNYMKALEFYAIQSTVVNQETKARDRLLIIRVEQCKVLGTARVPCIHLPIGLKEDNAVDENSICEFRRWEKATRPTLDNGINPSDILNKVTEMFEEFKIKITVKNLLSCVWTLILWCFAFSRLLHQDIFVSHFITLLTTFLKS